MISAQPYIAMTVLERQRRGGKTFVAGFGLAGVLMIAAIILAFILANPLLAVRDPVSKADVIVVLGGDGPPRAAWAAGLWLKGVAPRVLISGDGDCYWIREAMIDRGVDRRAIVTECQSGSTWENALFSAPILKQMNARSAVLVTSWYHSRRAMASFAATSKDIHWMSDPVEPDEPLWDVGLSHDGIQLLKEYPKTLWYAARLFLGIEPASRPVSFPSREVTP
ncbi:YdcF family protein [Phyllobacterium sp.]|uniref:YdcF family protein n=1 Tax=Phyllobacterium sp. TaxID=1871046 RepID=UPI0030F3EFC5